MTSPHTSTAVPTVHSSTLSAVMWMSLTAFLALMMLYFIGLDQGVTSLFGSDTHVHEFMHDGRHLLGFPCH